MGDLDELDAQLDDLESSLPDESLKHYASPYYDPVKAHEYYMKNRELKGENSRSSTAGLNDEGKAVAKYVKNQLDTERKGKVEDHNNQTQAQIDAKKNDMDSTIKTKKGNMTSAIESHKTQTTQKIEKLREELKGMSMDDWNKHAERIQSEIAKLRESNDTIRTKLQEAYSAESANLRTAYKNDSTNLRNEHKAESSRLKDEYDEKYKSELDKIKSDAKYLKTSKSSKKY